MDVTEIYASKVFSDAVMRARLPAKVYRSLKETSQLGKPIDPEIADVVAATMKDWAISQGATHYSHWFQPLSGRTAGKHDAFLNPGMAPGEYGKVVSEFSSSALVQGEPDASSFPSGGLRAVFEARGYTVWDPTSPAFVRDGTLFIPTAFSAYTGEALDEKTPLLRSMQALAPQALRILRLCKPGSAARAVVPTTGAEQEYFLVDRGLYEQRLDLRICGRTLFGRRTAKGQELDDYYCGRLRIRVSAFMRELDEELWRLGIPAKTKHNEAAPGQHELAPIFETDNVACDHNLLMMDVMRVTAKKHGLACLVHEKPFEGVNGSGKHNNFSLLSDDGINFLDPGKHPEENKLFLITLCAILEAVDSHADLIRLSAASPGNDCRLGGNEAPPAVISVFLGDALTDILEGIAYNMSREVRQRIERESVKVLPGIKMDNSDRNRTSPFAFTGNKFEFRMPGAGQSVSFCNAVLNTGIADVFARFAERLEKADDIERECADIVADTIKNHGRVIYNGNNYDKIWLEEAKRRGLAIMPHALDAFDSMVAPENVGFFTAAGVLNETECRARHEVLLESFVKTVALEAEVMLEMARRQIIPACAEYLGKLAGSLSALWDADIKAGFIQERLQALSKGCERAEAACKGLEAACETEIADMRAKAAHMQEKVRPAMAVLRAACDTLEGLAPLGLWPFPAYNDLLHRI